MRKFILRFVGLWYILIGLYGVTPGVAPLVSDSSSYNVFLIIMGALSLGAADLGGSEAEWFDFAFSVVLIFLTTVAAVNYLHVGTGTLGNILINGLAAIALLYVGLILNGRLKFEQK